jgi:hypothetical protein
MQEELAVRSELDLAVADLRKQLNVEQQAHTQTQQREASGKACYQETYMQLQMHMQELQVARTSQHDAGIQVDELQQQLDTAERQQCAASILEFLIVSVTW